MTLNASGPISLGGSTAGQSIAVELGLSPTAEISLNQTNVRTLAGVASGAITVPTNFYGKSNTYSVSYLVAAGGGGRGNGTGGQSGGSGVVILSVPTANYSGITTGSPTVTTSGANTIIKFTSSGSYTA